MEAETEIEEVLVDDHAVMLRDVGDAGFNTIRLTGVDLVVPVELDLDGDPLMDDVVSLRSAHGRYEQTLVVGDPDVEIVEAQRLAYYRFTDVPPGLYRVAVRIRDRWVRVIDGLLVTVEGAFVRGEALGAELPSEVVAPIHRTHFEDLAGGEDTEGFDEEIEPGELWAESPDAWDGVDDE